MTGSLARSSGSEESFEAVVERSERLARAVAGDDAADRIVLFQDTLERDFGHDRELLARQVERTLRHELAHHLGWDEAGVETLGL